MMHRLGARGNLVVAITFVAAAAGVAAADRLVLHSKDSLTLDGKTYVCDDATIEGTHLAIGDRLTIGALDLRCHAGGGTAGARPQTASLAVSSNVDPACVLALAQRIDGYVPHADALLWADACRTFEIGKRCAITSQADDTACVSALQQRIDGAFSDAEAQRAHDVCHVVQATCPAPPNPVRSSVDTGCLTNLWSARGGYPDDATLLAWLDTCRANKVGACTVVGGSLDQDCITHAAQMHDGYFTPQLAASVARSCRTLQLACP
jgi:hypothetical protein